MAGALSASFESKSDFALYFFYIVLMLVFLFPLFYFRMMGAGDIKLISVLSGLVGFKAGVMILISALFLALPVCFIKMLYQNNFKQRLTYFYVYFRQFYLTKRREAYYKPSRDGYENTIPFAAFLLAGAVVTKVFVQG